MFSLENERKTPDILIQYAKSEIQNIIHSVSGINFMMICSTDGFELASVYKKDTFNHSKVAAVSSSLHAMVSALTNELQLTGCQNITLDADNGKAIITAVPHTDYPMIIVALAEKNILIGQLLYALKQTSFNIMHYNLNH